MEQELKDIVVAALEDIKGHNIVVMDVREFTDVTDTMIVATGNTSRQVKALAENVAVEAKNAGFMPLGMEGEDQGEWVLVDLDHVVVHVMQPAIREFYNLEKLWELRPSERKLDMGDQ